MELDALANRARERNAAEGIGSFLVRTDDHFLQMIEGPPSAVSQLMDRIWDDRRHEDIDILLTMRERQLTAPGFPMGFVDLKKDREDNPEIQSKIAETCRLCRPRSPLTDWLEKYGAHYPLLAPGRHA